MNKEFTMSEDDYKELVEAGKSVPYMIVGRSAPSSPQERANAAWQRLGKKLGFAWDTVSPLPIFGPGARTFLATPLNETD